MKTLSLFRRLLSVMALLVALTGMGLLQVAAQSSTRGDRVRDRMMEILDEVSRLVRENYYDPALKNLDWKGAVEIARDRVRRADEEGEMSAAISGLLVRLDDSHTYFLRPMRLEPVIFGFRAKAFGEEPRIYEVMPGGPAEEAGLQLGDKILEVEEFAADRKLIDVEMRYFQYIDPRAELRLKVVRNGAAPRVYRIQGKQQSSSSKAFRKLYEDYAEENRKEMDDVRVQQRSGGIAYLRFPSFMVSPNKAASLLKGAKGAKAFVLDLRDNGGGREETMKEVAGHLLPQPTLLVLSISRKKKEEVIAKPKSPNITVPLVVMVDSHSASASEVLARVLQMKNRATIIGDVTAGKVNAPRYFGGVGGAVYMIPFGVAITVSRDVMPDGSELEGRGVTPDVKCLPTEEDLRLVRDPCLDRALMLARQASLSHSGSP